MSKKLSSDSNVKTGYYGYSSESKSGNGNSRNPKSPTRPNVNSKKKKNSTILGILLALLQLLASIFFIGFVIYKKFAFATTQRIIIAGVIFGVLFLIAFFMQIAKSIGVKRGGKVISVLVIIIIALLVYLIAFIPNTFTSGKKVSTEPFIVFASADDTFGSMSSKELGRSDTNILAVVNPKTHVVLMLSTPRDYYVPVQAKCVAPESYDKLTHCGLYGNGKATDKNGNSVTASDWQWAYEVNWKPGYNVLMNTLKKLYGFKLSSDKYHYVRINFTGFAKLIDSLGGITVDVDRNFTSRTYASYGDQDNGDRKTYVYKKGSMEMDGNTALTYARERHAFGEGDMARNKHQVQVLKAISNTFLSGSTLLHYGSVMDSIEDSFATDIDISSMVQLQTQVADDKDYDGWKIVSFSVIGQPARQVCTYTGSSLSVVMQDADSIARGTKLINMTLSGSDYKTVKSTAKKYTNAQAGE